MEPKNGLLRRVIPTVSVIFLVGTLAACLGPRPTYTPYPSANTNTQQYNRDVIECKNWAASQAGADPNRAFNEGAQGAIGGAVVGAILGRIFGGRRGLGRGALAGGVIGAGAGGMSGNQSAQQTYNMAYNDCLRKKDL